MCARHPLPYAYGQGRTRCCSRTTARRAWCCGPPETVGLPALLPKCCASTTSTASSAKAASTRCRARIAAALWRAANRGAASRTSARVESAVDLSRMMQELPAIEDPARSVERRADHPHAERAAHAGPRKTARATIHIEPYEALELGALSGSTARLREGRASRTRALHAALISRPEDPLAELDNRRAQAAAGRPHLAAHWRGRAVPTSVSRRCRRRTARRAGFPAPARQGRIEVHARRASA